MAKNNATGPIFKRGQIVEVKGDQIGGGTTWALYWFRGKVLQVNKKKSRVYYNIKMLDPTRFNQKSLTVRDIESRYVRSGIIAKKQTISKNKKNQSPRKKGAAAYAEAGAEGSVCESWEETLAREAAERAALSGAIKKRKKKKSGIPEEEEEQAGGEHKFDGKYRKGVDVRRKVAEVKTDEFHLIDRNKLKYGDQLFQTGDKIFYRDQVYDLRRLRIYKDRPVLILENKTDGIRRAEVGDCKIEKSVDDIIAEEEAAQKEADAEKEKATAGKEAADEKQQGSEDQKISDENAEKGEDDAKEEGPLSLDIPKSENDLVIKLTEEEAANAEDLKKNEVSNAAEPDKEDVMKTLDVGSV